MTSWAGSPEFFRRLIAAILVLVALAMIGRWPWALSVATGIAAIAVYIYYPRPSPPENALTYERFPSQIGPDWMGFLFGGALLALPVWGQLLDPELGVVHPSAVIAWPIGLAFNSFWVIGYLYASYWIVPGSEGLHIRDARDQRDVPFSQIVRLTPYEKRLPVWIRLLTPLLILSGRYGAAGAILMSRARSGITLHLRDGSSVAIAADSYEHAIRKIIRALKAHGIEMEK